MVRLINRIKINKPIKEVYKFLSKPENIPLWNYYVKKVYPIETTKDGKTIYNQVRKTDSQRIIIEEKKSLNILIISTIGDSKIKFKRTIELKKVKESSCWFEDRFDVDLGTNKLFQKFYRLKMQHAVKENLIKLKELLETGITLLQNGKKSEVSIQSYQKFN